MATEDRERPAAGDRQAKLLRATPGYFAASGIDFLAGRSFDAGGARSEAIVSERFARALGLRAEEIVGRHLPEGTFQFGRPPREIVGVVRDVRVLGPDAGFEAALYIPLGDWPSKSIDIVVKGRADPRGLVTAIREAMRRIDLGLPLYDIRTFEDLRATFSGNRRFVMMVMLMFGGLSFGLAIVGLYSVTSYIVQLRTREIGIRMALGATPGQVRAQIMFTGALHAGCGIAVGALSAAALFRLAAAYVHGLGALDWVSVITVASAVGIVAIAATWLPASRATRVDPIASLRAE